MAGYRHPFHSGTFVAGEAGVTLWFHLAMCFGAAASVWHFNRTADALQVDHRRPLRRRLQRRGHDKAALLSLRALLADIKPRVVPFIDDGAPDAFYQPGETRHKAGHFPAEVNIKPRGMNGWGYVVRIGDAVFYDCGTAPAEFLELFASRRAFINLRPRGPGTGPGAGDLSRQTAAEVAGVHRQRRRPVGKGVRQGRRRQRHTGGLLVVHGGTLRMAARLSTGTVESKRLRRSVERRNLRGGGVRKDSRPNADGINPQGPGEGRRRPPVCEPGGRRRADHPGDLRLLSRRRVV